MTQTYPHSPQGGEPVCPRHPDRISYVRCQRCDKPVCPQCQVPSSVGIHCVDCVARANRTRRPARSLLGGVAVSDSRITMGLIAACIAVYLGQMAHPALTTQFGFVPLLAMSQPWRFLTTAFLHGSVMHLAFNMWALWVCGCALEPVLGRWRFAALYGLSALGGSVAIAVLASPMSQDWLTLTVGASGAVFGLFGALFVVQRRFGRDTSAILVLLGINLVISLMGSGISWQGHLGGLVTGTALAAVFAWAPRRHRGLLAVLGCALVLILLVGAVLLRYMFV